MTRGKFAATILSSVLAVTALVTASPPALAGSNFARLDAFGWAKTQAGKPYEYGGIGPGGYDCSGLVYAAYKREGFTLPRTTEGMLASSMLGRTNSPRPGELAFFGSGHVEFVTTVRHLTYGALKPGTTLGWHTWYPGSGWQPTEYLYVKGAQ